MYFDTYFIKFLFSYLERSYFRRIFASKSDEFNQHNNSFEYIILHTKKKLKSLRVMIS